MADRRAMIAALLLALQAPASEAAPAEPSCDAPVYMTVAGPTHDRARMQAYARAIAESGLYQKLGGYYVNGPVPLALLNGDPPAGYTTLIVRFPCLANAEAFWNSDIYQNEIVPLRTNPSAGDYLIHVWPEVAPPDHMRGKVGRAPYLAEFDGVNVPDPVRFADPPGSVFAPDTSDATRAVRAPGWPEAAMLRRDAASGEAWRFDLPDGARFAAGIAPGTMQLYVLAQDVAIAGLTLSAGDFAHIPAGTDLATARAEAGASFVLFVDPPGKGSIAAPIAVARGAETEWRAGQVAPDAGGEPVLEVKPLWNDAETGAQVHLVRIAAGKWVPWELHPSVEEGYLLDGDYRLAECLPSGRRDFVYGAGGYLYRQPGILHSGPDSFSTTGATWLIRTPAKLSALFYPGCPTDTIPEDPAP